MPLTSSVMGQMMARFRNFNSLQKVKIWLKKGAKRHNAFRTGAKIYLSEKMFWGYEHFKDLIRHHELKWGT